MSPGEAGRASGPASQLQWKMAGEDSMAGPILEVRGISKRFFATQALSGVSLQVSPGSVHAVVGENGAGKSTLMNVIGGVYQPDEGEIFLEGRKVTIRTPDDALGMGIGFVHQEIALCQHISVAENIFMPAIRGAGLVNFKDIHERTKALLAEFEGHGHMDPRQKVRELGVSQQQVIEIVKALSVNCKIIIFDEPTAALTESETEVLFRIIGTLKKRGIGILYISHRLAEIYRIADTVTVLRDGCLIETSPVANMDQMALVNRMVGRDLKDIYPEKSHAAASHDILEVQGLCNDGLFQDVSFTLRRGEILGFAGLVGSGRTEVARTICGLLSKTAGSVTLEGRREEFRDYRDAIGKGVVYLTENRALEGLFLDLSIAKNVSVMDLDLVSRFSLIGARAENALAERYAGEMQIKLASVGQKANSLSGGNQQKVLIAKLLSVTPKVVIMDEPTRGIDIGAKAQIYHLLRALASKGVGVIMISSELPEVIGTCDRVAVMYEGRICGILEGEGVNEQSIIQMACLSNEERENQRRGVAV
jgi:ribose transport system ATP-binding protein